MKGKKIKFMTACAVLCTMLLSGCAAEEFQVDVPTEQEQVQESEQGSETPVVSSVPELVMEHRYDEVWDPNFEHVLARGAFDAVSVSAEGYEALQAGLDTWNQENQKNYQTSMEEIEEWARTDSAMWETSDGYGYTVEYSLEAARVDAQVVSLVKNGYEYGGGAHGNYWFDAACFDVQTGTRLKLRDLFEDADGFEAWAREEGWKRLEKEYGEGLFPDAREVYDGVWKEDPVWYLDAKGINLLFSPYELGPYAMGEVRLVYPYDECAAWLKSAYGAPGSNSVAELPLEAETAMNLGESGGSHIIKLWVDAQENRMGEVCLDVDGTTHKLDLGERLGSAYIIRKENGRVFLLFDADQASDDYATWVYDLTEGTPVLTAREYMEIVPGCVSVDRLQTTVRLDLLGTYRSSQEYELTEEGTFIRISENYPIANKFGYGILTTKQPIPVVYNGQEKVLPAGTRLQMTGTDKEGIAWYRLVETGEEGEIHFEYANEMRNFVNIDGKSEIDCFEDLPYAG